MGKIRFILFNFIQILIFIDNLQYKIMKVLPLIALVGLIIGVSFLALDQGSLSLQKEVQPAQYDKELSKRYAAYSKIAYCP